MAPLTSREQFFVISRFHTLFIQWKPSQREIFGRLLIQLYGRKTHGQNVDNDSAMFDLEVSMASAYTVDTDVSSSLTFEQLLRGFRATFKKLARHHKRMFIQELRKNHPEFVTSLGFQ